MLTDAGHCMKAIPAGPVSALKDASRKQVPCGNVNRSGLVFTVSLHRQAGRHMQPDAAFDSSLHAHAAAFQDGNATRSTHQLPAVLIEQAL